AISSMVRVILRMLRMALRRLTRARVLAMAFYSGSNALPPALGPGLPTGPRPRPQVSSTPAEEGDLRSGPGAWSGDHAPTGAARGRGTPLTPFRPTAP